MRLFLPSCMLIITCLSCLTSCGYHFGYGSLPSRFNTIAVPYVEGDADGFLTAALIRDISQAGAFRYSNCEAQLILKVKILDFSDQNIGFRYDRNKKGRLTTSIIPTETRATILAEVEVIDAQTCCVVLGPAKLKTYVDYDHDYYNSRNGVNIFSLGQLSDVDAAEDAMYRPLYDRLATKIVDYVTESW